ncbi:hypothetical protein ACIGEH_14405 [Bacillus altitudinis]|uniref:hypothetical protein n=1 Tax=Bacillus altitudinis TaxID=293387 RepID=UPI0037C564F9
MTETKYKTEKRKANVGERILITDDAYAISLYEKGTVLTVSSVDAKGEHVRNKGGKNTVV